MSTVTPEAAAPIRSTAASIAELSRSQSDTVPPSAAIRVATASPIPAAPPVTTARRPSKRFGNTIRTSPCDPSRAAVDAATLSRDAPPCQRQVEPCGAPRCKRLRRLRDGSPSIRHRYRVGVAPRRSRAVARARMKDVSNVQVLRGLAALGVVVAHAQGELIYRDAPNPLPSLEWGAFGVDVFFVISGFVMAYASANAFGSLRSVWPFMIRRIIRIAPLYWIATLAFALLLARGAETLSDFRIIGRHVLQSIGLLALGRRCDTGPAARLDAELRDGVLRLLRGRAAAAASRGARHPRDRAHGTRFRRDVRLAARAPGRDREPAGHGVRGRDRDRRGAPGRLADPAPRRHRARGRGPARGHADGAAHGCARDLARLRLGRSGSPHRGRPRARAGSAGHVPVPPEARCSNGSATPPIRSI